MTPVHDFVAARRRAVRICLLAVALLASPDFLFQTAAALRSHSAAHRVSIVSAGTATAGAYAEAARGLEGRDGDRMRTIAALSLGMLVLAVALARHRARLRKAEQQARMAFVRQEMAMRGADLGYWEWNLKTGVIVRSQRILDRLGIEPSEISPMGMGILKFVHPEDAEALSSRIEAHRKGEAPNCDVEFRIRAKSGNWIWILNRGRIVEWDKDGSPLRMAGTHLDITEQKRSLEAAQENEERLRRLVENMPVMMDAFDANWTPVAWNSECERVTGYTADEIVGNPKTLELLYPDARYRERMLGELERRGYDFRDWEWEITCKNGEKRTILWHNISGRIPIPGWHSWAIGVDITRHKRAEEERRKLEAQIQQAQKLESLGVLAGGIAHDFNNLLVGILGNADLALSELSPLAPARENLKDIERAARRAAELCRQMLAYSGKGRFVIEAIDLSKLVAEMSHMLEVSISKKAVLKYNFAPNLPAIEGDPTQIRQIVMNLITNASDAIGDKSGAICISTGAMECDRAYLRETYLDEDLPEGVYVYCEVSDTGCGMDEATRLRLFEPFFTTKFTGRGLGLSAALGIVRGHRGAIKVYSEPGRGSTFKVLFPCIDRPASVEEDESSSEAAQWRGHGEVLLVDDEETVRAVGKRMLERMGFAVAAAADGREALALFKQRNGAFDCVLMDLMMPHMDGEEAFREMRRINPRVRVILSSGYNENEVTERFSGKGLAGFIQKPYRLESLRQILVRIGL